MCKNIRTLYNFSPPATDEEIHAACLQFVRKISGSSKPSKANEAAFENAVANVSAAVRQLLLSLSASALPRNREVKAEKARNRIAYRFVGHGRQETS